MGQKERLEVIQKICIEEGYFPPDDRTLKLMNAAYELGYCEAMGYVNKCMDKMLGGINND